jgi:hypothetical protein
MTTLPWASLGGPPLVLTDIPAVLPQSRPGRALPLVRKRLNQQRVTAIVAAITITGDFMCRATNVTYRMDTPSARAFLGHYVSLP